MDQSVASVGALRRCKRNFSQFYFRFKFKDFYNLKKGIR